MRLPLLTLSVVLICGLISGCGTETPAPIAPTGTATDSPAPAAPSTPTVNGGGTFSSGTPTPTVSSGGATSASSPDAAVRQLLQALEYNKYEKIWDLLPKSYQDEINGIFQAFGEQVDPELWDKSFNLASRYISVMLAKEDMMYQTPEMQESFTSLKTIAAMTGGGNTDWLTVEKFQELVTPLNKVMVSLLACELSSTRKLKAFDGRVFCAKTLGPMVGNVRKVVEQLLKEAAEIEDLKSNIQVQMLLQQADVKKLFDSVKISVKEKKGETAVVLIEVMGTLSEVNMILVEGKWVPEQLTAMFGMGIGMAKAQIPAIALQVNSVKDRVLPMLEVLEPFIIALQEANTQEDFNIAYADLNQQAPDIIGKAIGMPSLSAKLGGGYVQVSPVTIQVTSELSEEQLMDLIEKLEFMTDDPPRAIALPTQSDESWSIQLTPVRNASAFSESITFAKSVEYDPRQKTIVLTLNPAKSDTTGNP